MLHFINSYAIIKLVVANMIIIVYLVLRNLLTTPVSRFFFCLNISFLSWAFSCPKFHIPL